MLGRKIVARGDATLQGVTNQMNAFADLCVQAGLERSDARHAMFPGVRRTFAYAATTGNERNKADGCCHSAWARLVENAQMQGLRSSHERGVQVVRRSDESRA